MMGFDKELLFKDALPEVEVHLPGKGTVRVRALTRAEVLKTRSQVKSIRDAIARQAQFERRTLATALLDPELTMEEVEVWQERSAAGEIDLVVEAIEIVSGMRESNAKAAKEAMKEFEADPEAEFPLPPR